MVLAGTLLLIAWGTFAFGAVYPWAYVPLAAGCALVGGIGLLSGDRPVWARNRLLLAALAGVAVVGLLQLVPLPRTFLETVSPGTSTFLTRFDLAWSRAVDPTTGLAIDLRHPISLAPSSTMRALGLLASFTLLLVGLIRSLSRTIAGRLARGVVFIGFLLAIVGIIQKAMLGDAAFSGMRIYGFWQPEDLLSTPFGPYVNKNHFAGWMLMAIPLALGLAIGPAQSLAPSRRSLRSMLVWLSESEGGGMALYLVAAMVMTFSLLMTGSRSGTACLIALWLGVTVVAGRRASRRTTLVAGALSAAALVIALQWAGHDARLDRFVTDNDSLAMRLDIWRMSTRIVRDFTLLGSGLDTFGTASILYQTAGKDLHYNEAHNDYLQVLVEGGFVTAALLVVALIGIVVSAMARLRSREDGVELHWIRLGALAGVGAVGLQSLVEFSLQMPGNAALFVVLLALVLFTPAAYRSQP